MNIEFLIHGTLSDGQSSWKETDQDYCARSYVANRQENVVLDIEVQKSGKGLSTYYNYLRYKNISAPRRTGSYFGITVRLDGLICTDVKSMYHILDMLFNKMVVGNLLIPNGGGYIYSFDSFKTKENDLLAIQNQFISLFNATFFSKDDFIQIPSSYTKKNSVLCVNSNEVNKATVAETLKGGNKLCVSVTYKTKIEIDAEKSIENANSEANAKVRAAEEKLQTEVNAVKTQMKTQLEEQANSIKQQMSASENSKKGLEQKIKNLTTELDRTKELLREKSEECVQLSQDRLSRDILAQFKEIKSPLLKWATNMDERSKSINTGNALVGNVKSDIKKSSDKITIKIPSWIHALNTLLLLIVILLLSFNIFKSGEFLGSSDIGKGGKEHVIKEQQPKGEDKISMDTEFEIEVTPSAENETLKYGKVYQISLDDKDMPEGAYWDVQGGSMTDQNSFKVTALAGFPIQIELHKGNVIIAKKEFKIVE